jgi:hypothetical protein
MKKSFAFERFKKWRNNFVENPTLPPVTDSALITKEDLQALFADMETMNADSVRIYFLRFEPDINEPQEKKVKIAGKYADGCTWAEAGNGLSQLAIALTPTKNYRIDPKTYIVTAEDITDRVSITLLIPGRDIEGPTGHNPPPSTEKIGN